jgi:hypothetical protein
MRIILGIPVPEAVGFAGPGISLIPEFAPLRIFI